MLPRERPDGLGRGPHAGESRGYERAGVAGPGRVRLERRAEPHAPGPACRLPSHTPSAPRRAPGPQNCLRGCVDSFGHTRAAENTAGKEPGAWAAAERPVGSRTRLGNQGRILDAPPQPPPLCPHPANLVPPSSLLPRRTHATAGLQHFPYGSGVPWSLEPASLRREQSPTSRGAAGAVTGVRRTRAAAGELGGLGQPACPL